MALKWTLKKSTTIPGDENIGVTIHDVIVEFETGSLKEAYGFFEGEDVSIRRIFGASLVSRIDWSPEEKGTEVQQPSEAAAEPAKRGRGPNKPKPDAIAPPPMPVPPIANGATMPTLLPPNAMTIPEDGGIPAALKRDATNTAPALIAPPPMLPSPPTAPTPPPVGVLGPKVVHSLDNLKKGNVATDPTGQQLSDWLAAAGLTIKGASYDDACRTVLMTSDEKLREIAQALGA